jgi:hypothetical protein
MINARLTYPDVLPPLQVYDLILFYLLSVFEKDGAAMGSGNLLLDEGDAGGQHGTA